jgi:hypothetical protein
MDSTCMHAGSVTHAGDEEAKHDKLEIDGART